MNHANVDLWHVAEGVEHARETGDRVSVWDSDARMRCISHEEMKDRNLYHPSAEEVCSIKVSRAGMLTLSFHENQVEGTFTLNPVGTGALDPQQASQPDEIGSEALAFVVKQINYAYGVHKWDFGKVDAASIAQGGYPTDYEFEFEAFV